MNSVEQVLCDNCNVIRSIPVGQWYLSCETCSHLVIRRVESGFKYLQKKCNGSKKIIRVPEEATRFYCQRCHASYITNDTVLRRKCGQDIFAAEEAEALAVDNYGYTLIEEKHEKRVDRMSKKTEQMDQTLAMEACQKLIQSMGLESNGETVQQLKNQVADKDKEIAELREKLKLAEKHLAKKDIQVATKETEIGALKTKLENTGQKLITQDTRYSKILRKSKERTQLLEKQMKSVTADFNSFKLEKEKEVEELRSQVEAAKEEDKKYLKIDHVEFGKLKNLLATKNMEIVGLQFVQANRDRHTFGLEKKIKTLETQSKNVELNFKREIDMLKSELKDMSTLNNQINEINMVALKKIKEVGAEKEKITQELRNFQMEQIMKML